jgi:hypothetical protein
MLLLDRMGLFLPGLARPTLTAPVAEFETLLALVLTQFLWLS